MHTKRIPLLENIEKRQGSRALLFVTGDRPGLETQIHSETFDYFVNILDKIGVVKKISLILYTRGGDTLAAWSIINLIRQFCDELEVIIPSKAHSSGTLMALGADHIIMTKQATLGPIDPSVNTPLNPQIVGGSVDARYPVSVEAVNGYIELAIKQIGVESEQSKIEILKSLSTTLHPLVLGQVVRAKSQIKMLAQRLMRHQVKEEKQQEKVIKFLCSESGSHDYTINRREAKDELGLSIGKPSAEFYAELKSLYDNIAEDLQLAKRFDPHAAIGQQSSVDYQFRRCIIQSVDGGNYCFLTEGKLQKVTQGPGMPIALNDNRIFEGWRHVV